MNHALRLFVSRLLIARRVARAMRRMYIPGIV